MFQKRHYEVIAKLIKEAKIHGDSLIEFEEEIIHIFAQDNSNFNPSRFRSAIEIPKRKKGKWIGSPMEQV